MTYHDSRVIKTHEALHSALLNLLMHNEFKKITVHDLCKQAKVSRATFYVHFLDKFDFLKYFLETIDLDLSNCGVEDVERFNQFLLDNKVIIGNLLIDAENETLRILFEFIENFLNIKNDNVAHTSEYIVLSNIISGGIISYIYWQIDNRFPFELKKMNEHLFDIIKTLKKGSNFSYE